jgi:hypothetical protein
MNQDGYVRIARRRRLRHLEVCGALEGLTALLDPAGVGHSPARPCRVGGANPICDRCAYILVAAVRLSAG